MTSTYSNQGMQFESLIEYANVRYYQDRLKRSERVKEFDKTFTICLCLGKE